jgi:hypothetical protein
MPGVLGRIRDAAVRPLVTGMLEKSMLARLNKIRADVGALPVASADEFVRRAPLMLVASGKPFEYPQTDWGDAVAVATEMYLFHTMTAQSLCVAVGVSAPDSDTSRSLTSPRPRPRSTSPHASAHLESRPRASPPISLSSARQREKITSIAAPAA